MSQTAQVWAVVLLALLAANLPFLTERFMAVVRLNGGKNLALRLVELVLWYFIVGLIARALEHQAGQVAPQGWEFYTITGSLFLTFAFPGFAYRYLFKLR
jgi:hypothetical protein